MADDFKMTPAWRARTAVWASIGTAHDIGATRAVDPDAYPGVPREGVAEWMARKTLAQLLNLGFEPEGWQEAFSTMPGEDEGTTRTDVMPPVRLPDEGVVSLSGQQTDNGYEIQVHTDMPDHDEALKLLEKALDHVRRFGFTREDGE